MPRGVYDRAESRVRRLTVENARLVRELNNTRNTLERVESQLKTASKSKPATVADEVSHKDKFTVLRENLQGLAEARKTLVNSDQMSDAVLNTLDSEISAHLMCLSQLRATAFPVAATPRSAELPAPLPGTTVPFPQMPSGFQPVAMR